MSDFTKSEGGNADAIDQLDDGGHSGPGQNAVIEDRADSDDAASAQSTGKMDPQAPGWTKRVRVGKHPLDRTPYPHRIGALEETIRGYVDKLVDHVVMTAIGLTFDSLGEAYNFYNLYSWEHGFGIRYGKSRLNAEKTKCLQEVVCGCSWKCRREVQHVNREAREQDLHQSCVRAVRRAALSSPYRIEEIEKSKMYKAVHTQGERREKWARVVYGVKIIADGEKFECEWAIRAYGHALLPHVESYGCIGVHRDTKLVDREEVDKGC